MAKIHLSETGSVIFSPMCSRGHRILMFDAEEIDSDKVYRLDKDGKMWEVGGPSNVRSKLFGIFGVKSLCPECGEPYVCELAFNVGLLQRVSRQPETLLDSDIGQQQAIRLKVAL